ncbi:hypothetical protein Leryth_009843 [Lithospermum erythrorhizon]|nr:hypothetical protein Leryth_009843 [Lithospermum erythrorhizon]
MRSKVRKAQKVRLACANTVQESPVIAVSSNPLKKSRIESAPANSLLVYAGALARLQSIEEKERPKIAAVEISEAKLIITKESKLKHQKKKRQKHPLHQQMELMFQAQHDSRASLFLHSTGLLGDRRSPACPTCHSTTNSLPGCLTTLKPHT